MTYSEGRISSGQPLSLGGQTAIEGTIRHTWSPVRRSLRKSFSERLLGTLEIPKNPDCDRCRAGNDTWANKMGSVGKLRGSLAGCHGSKHGTMCPIVSQSTVTGPGPWDGTRSPHAEQAVNRSAGFKFVAAVLRALQEAPIFFAFMPENSCLRQCHSL